MDKIQRIQELLKSINYDLSQPYIFHIEIRTFRLALRGYNMETRETEFINEYVDVDDIITKLEDILKQ